MKTTLGILCCFVVGIAMGRWGSLSDPSLIGHVSFGALCLLMLSVGIMVGSDKTMLRQIRALPRLTLWLPVCTIVGTLAGSLLAAVLVHRLPMDCLAVGSGFGYYSLSSLLIGDLRGAELGTIALVSNIMREVFTLLLAPLLVRYCGAFAPIASGGATTADTSLPVIMQYAGARWTTLSIFHGCVVDFSVPFLVTFFCTL
ncbi:MAG: lysine exporter LysO family protein [Alloprevotella sp.]